MADNEDRFSGIRAQRITDLTIAIATALRDSELADCDKGLSLRTIAKLFPETHPMEEEDAD